MAVVLVLTVGLLLGVSVALGPDESSPLLRAVDTLAQWLGPLLLIVLVVYLGRRRFVSWVDRRLRDITGPTLIRDMPPRTVLGALFPGIYGDKVGHQDVITSVLGGAGREPSGADTAVSRNSTALFRLRSIDDSACASEITWTHEFSGVRNNHRYVIFATCDEEIYSLVTRERIFPLFELWMLDNDDQLEEFVPNLRDSLQIGADYLDVDGVLHVAEPRALYGEEVAFRDYEQYVRLPGGVDRKNLRIIQFDLYDLADPDDIVESVERLSVRASSVFPANVRFLSWSPPYPCFLRHVTFDVSELPRDGETLDYLVMPATVKRVTTPYRGRWISALDRIDVPIDSWMLPGHSVTLVWRPVDGAEPRNASHRT
jgi:hypothetical protein